MLPNDKLGEGWAAQRSGLQQDDVMGSSSALETIAATPGSNLTSQTGGIFMNLVTQRSVPDIQPVGYNCLNTTELLTLSAPIIPKSFS